MSEPPADLTPSLVVALRAGDADAAGLLDTLYRERLTRFARGYLGDADAEDAVQEVFAKVLAADAVPGHFRAWLYRVARHHCLNRRRDRGRRPEAPLATDLDLAASATGDLTRLARAEERAELARSLERLPEAQREVLRLRYGEDLSREEIAAVLDLPESVVKSRLYEGLKRLRGR